MSNRLEELRKETGFNQTELCNEINIRSNGEVEIKQSTYSQYASGDRPIPLDVLKLFGDLYNCSIDYILCRSDIRTPINNLVNPSLYTNIPIVGTIAAGMPILANENIEGYISIPSDILSCNECFYLRIKGDSMINAGIKPNDFVLIKKQDFLENNGDIIAVIINDENEATLKRAYKTDNGLILQPENSAYSPISIPLKNMNNVIILGKVISIFSNNVK